MPNAQIIDLESNLNPLEKTLGGFIKRTRENQVEQQESDALKDIYGKYQQDGNNILETIKAIQTRPGISPTTRVNSIKQLMEFQKYNGELQKKAQADSEKADKNKNIIADLEQRRGLTPGSLGAYESDPKMGEQVSRPIKDSKINQADRPIDPEQQANIDKVINSPQWSKATNAQRQQLLSRGNVSTPNQKIILDTLIEEEKGTEKKQIKEKEFEYKIHKDTQNADESIEKEAKSALTQLDAIKDVEKAIKNVSPYSAANILKSFGEVGKRVSDAILSKDETKIQASVPAFLEGRKELFGVRLSDADLKLLSDKLPDMGKSPEANKEIINMMKKYSKLAILRQKISHDIKKKNKGFRPLNYLDDLNQRYYEMTKPVKIINPTNGRVIDIPAFEVEDALLSGATLYNE